MTGLSHTLDSYDEMARRFLPGYAAHVSDVEAAFPMLPFAPWVWPFMLPSGGTWTLLEASQRPAQKPRFAGVLIHEQQCTMVYELCLAGVDSVSITLARANVESVTQCSQRFG